MRRLATLADATKGPAPLAERPVQRQAIHLLGLVRIRCVHIPNSSKLAGDKRRRAIQMRNMKLDGLRPGFPDLMLFDETVQLRVGYIEVKREDGGAGLSDRQMQWEDDLTSWGFPFGIITLPEQALDVVKRWGWR